MNKQLLFGSITSPVERRATPSGIVVAETRLVTEDVVNRAAAQSIHKQTHFLRAYGGVALRMLDELSEGALVWVEGSFVSEVVRDQWKWHTKVADFKKIGQREPAPAAPPRKAPPPPACLLDD